MLASLSRAGFTEPTEVQNQAIQIVLAGQDLMASAQTGSGKTAAYAVPIIDRMKKPQAGNRRPQPQVLVLVPTRELVLQVMEQFERFGRHLRTIAVYGGTGYHGQVRNLHRGCDVIVATPGRLLDLVDQGYCNLSFVHTLVLDEADRLMDMGFMPQVRDVVEGLSQERQTLMFSATIDRRVEQIAAEFLTNPAIVRSTVKQIDAASIEQKIHLLKESNKDEVLLGLITGAENTSVLVFTKTRRGASKVTKRLRAANVSAEEIHSDVSQSKRERIMARYRKAEFSVLVATDIAARGLDVPQIGLVVNYDLPMCAQDYVHRIGRTGRAGRSGIAHSLVSESDRSLLRDIERLIGRRFDGQPLKAATPSSGSGKRQGSSHERQGGGYGKSSNGRRRFSRRPSGRSHERAAN